MAEPVVHLDASELEAIRVARANIAQVMRRQVDIALHSKSESQSRQAAEIVMRYALADRGQQLEVDGKITPGGGITNINLTKVDAQMINIMDNLPVALKIQFAQVMEAIEEFQTQNMQAIFEGEIIEDTNAPHCKCGCGERVNKRRDGTYPDWVKGHHLRKHVASPAILEARAKGLPPRARAKREQEKA